MKYPVSKPTITELERRYVSEVMESGNISSISPFVGKFEESFASYHKALYGVACSSGTNALTLAVRALGLGEGDEVIVPDFTMIASAWGVTYSGAKPVFVDCGDDLNIDVTKIEEKITPRTKAIMAVHIYGRQCNMKEIMRIAYEYNLYVIEDSCEAHGVPLVGDIACFSLYGNKIITSGEGGICVTNSERLMKQMQHLRSVTFDVKHTFHHKKMGYNFRMTGLQAAVALAQVERIDEILEKRKQIEAWYDKYLPESIKMPKRDVLWMYDVKVDDKDKFMQLLEEKGIETRPFFKPMRMQVQYYDEAYKSSNAYKMSQVGLYLPTYFDLTEEDVKYISEAVINTLKQ